MSLINENVAECSISLTHENFNLNRGSDKINFLKLPLYLLTRSTCLIIKPDAKIHFTFIQINRDISCVKGDMILELMKSFNVQLIRKIIVS